MSKRNRSQIVTGSQKHRDPRLLPCAFTENGAIMAANVLNSPEAVRMSVFVVRAFVQMRDLLGGTKELAKQLAALEKKLTDRLDGHEADARRCSAATATGPVKMRCLIPKLMPRAFVLFLSIQISPVPASAAAS